MGPRGWLEFIRRRWWLLVLGPLAAAVAAFFVSKGLTPVYEARATILVNQTQTPGVVLYNDVLASERLTSTYAELVTSRTVLTQVRNELALPYDETALKQKITVSPVRDTQILRINVEDADRQLAARIANTVARAFIDNNSSQLSRPGTVSIAELATVPSVPVKPNIPLNTVLATMVAILVAGGIAMVLEYLDDTVKTAEGVEALIGLPTLGNIAQFRTKGRAGSLLLLSQDMQSESAETYRQLRTNVQFANLGASQRSLVVTSANPGEGKSTTAANLAIVLAQTGKKVILVDTDLRRPTLHRLFEVPNSFGLTGLLLSEMVDGSQAMLATRVKNLSIVPAGPLPPNPSELLTSQLMGDVMKSMAKLADFVIFDSPPILAVTDASIIAGRTDGSILVVEAGKTRTDQMRRAHRALTQTGTRSLGVVLNKMRRGRQGHYYYYRYRPADTRTSTEQAADLAPARSRGNSKAA